MARSPKIYLEDLIDRMVDRLHDARRVCHSPGDNFAYDLFLELRDLSRRAVRVSRSRCFASASRDGDKILVELNKTMKMCLAVNSRYGR